MGRMATLEKAADLGDVALDTLRWPTSPARSSGLPACVPSSPSAPTSRRVDPARQEALKQIISDLHAGTSMDELKPRFAALIEDVEAGEIAAMEQAPDGGGHARQRGQAPLRRARAGLCRRARRATTRCRRRQGHPVDTFQRENQALLQVAASLRKVTEAIGDAGRTADAWLRLKGATGGPWPSGSRKSRSITCARRTSSSPSSSAHGVEGPSKVMWAFHDDIRAVMKELRAALAADDAGAGRPRRPPARRDERRHGDQGGEGPLPDGDGDLSEEEWAADPRRRGGDRLRPDRRVALLAGRPGRRHSRTAIARRRTPPSWSSRAHTAAL